MKRIRRWMLPLIVSLSIGVPVVASYIIPDHSITDAKIQSGGLNTSSIANNAVTQAKRAALNIVTSGSTGTSPGYQFTSTFQQITNFSISVTTTGRTVQLGIIPDGNGTGNPAEWQFNPANSNDAAYINIKRGSTIVCSWGLSGNSASTSLYIPPSLMCSDTPAAGTYTYTGVAEYFKGGASTPSAFLINSVLQAYEL